MTGSRLRAGLMAVLLAGAVLTSGGAVAENADGEVRSEVHGDWRVVCVKRESGERCTASQIQTERDSGQRALAIELHPADNGGVNGALALPFGLALPRGVALALDDAEPGSDVRGFSTCLPDGCIAPLRFDTEAAKALKAAKVLKVYAVAASDGQRVLFQISLTGLGAALDALRR